MAQHTNTKYCVLTGILNYKHCLSTLQVIYRCMMALPKCIISITVHLICITSEINAEPLKLLIDTSENQLEIWPHRDYHSRVTNVDLQPIFICVDVLPFISFIMGCHLIFVHSLCPCWPIRVNHLHFGNNRAF